MNRCFKSRFRITFSPEDSPLNHVKTFLYVGPIRRRLQFNGCSSTPVMTSRDMAKKRCLIVSLLLLIQVSRFLVIYNSIHYLESPYKGVSSLSGVVVEWP